MNIKISTQFTFFVSNEIVQHLMKGNSFQLLKIASLRGENFVGNLRLNGDAIRLDIISFQQQNCYFTELNSIFLKDNLQNYLPFRKAADLFDQLVSNKKLQISKDRCLIVPIMETSVKCKEEMFHQCQIKIQLKDVAFGKAGQERTRLFNEIKNGYKKKNSLLSIMKNIKKPIPINFMGDTTNPHYKYFEVTKNGKRITMNEDDYQCSFNHCQALPNFGIYQFKIRIIKTEFSSISMGICGRNLEGQFLCRNSKYYSGIYLGQYRVSDIQQIRERIQLIRDLKNRKYLQKRRFQNKDSIFKLEINMNEKQLTIYRNDQFYSKAIVNQRMLQFQIYPIVGLYCFGDIIQFVE